MSHRSCAGTKTDGQPCNSPCVEDDDYCFFHSPTHAAEAAEARRLGGLNRKREVTLKEVYSVERVETVEEIRRIVEIATLGLLAAENSISRNRALLAAAATAAKLLEVGMLADQINELRMVLEPRLTIEATEARRWNR